MQDEATVNAGSAALLTAMMNCVLKRMCVCVCRDCSLSRQRGRDKVGLLLTNRRTAVREGERGSGKTKRVESEV